MSRLEPILAARRRSVAEALRRPGADRLRERARAMPAARDFRAALAGPGLAAIAELKRRSPSAGELKGGADAAATARLYEAAGAAALSILTEPDYFAGDLSDLVAARAAVGVPVLRKDFVVHPWQLAESRAAGADAVLLIVAALGRATGDLLAEARRLGLQALVEVHDEAELALAIDAGADLVGVNNRNLADLSVDLRVAERLIPLLPRGIVAVAESGVERRDDAARMARAGAAAILVGTALMRAADPARALRELIA
jgi:indole-3-glycerol phosphate synthase